MSQVIIVSNRLPISVKKEDGQLTFSPTIGGLATGLSSYVNDRNNIWIGWPGIPSDDLTDADKQAVTEELSKHNYHPVFLSNRQIEDFYNGYSNSVLWPLFHNLPGKSRWGKHADTEQWWRAYRSVNKQYSEVILSLAMDKSRIWIHDYQLMLLPEMLRGSHKNASIGFFLHIPFPNPKQLSKLPERRKLLRGILGADLVGFHTIGYVDDFLANCQAEGLGSVTDGLVVLPDHTVRVGEFPMGIDYEKYAAAIHQRTVKSAVKRYQRLYRKKKVIVSVDRLDPSKGLIERLKAYKTFLERNPKQRGKIVFAMVAAPSRTSISSYKNLAKRLGRLVEDINYTFGTPDWKPVDYMNEAKPFEEVTALFRIADVAFIAPLRDGMNLAAKEFVASNGGRGVLILSETAGAAEELQDALIVDPSRPETLVEALEQALSMRKRELRSRLKHMRQLTATNTVHDWAKTFVDTLRQPVPGTPHITRTLSKRLRSLLLSQHDMARKRLLLLDYDGSLVPFTDDYKSTKPPKSLLALLESLGKTPRTDVVLISGRSSEDLGKWFGHLPINLVAEHGATTKKAGNKTWKVIERENSDWRPLLQPALERYAKLTPGAKIEVKPHSLVWHYRAASPYQAQKYTVIIKRTLRPFLKTHGLEILQGNKVLEIKNPKISKGAAAEVWFSKDYDFTLAIGDDATDEELFAALPMYANSIKVGRGRTAAHFRVESYKDILSLLKKMV
jgi:trehalose 6-phosphate synthase/phosphatase